LKYLMLSSVRIGSSTRSVVMTFWCPRPVTSRSLGLLEVPAASSANGCWAPASQDAFSTYCLWSKQIAMGGQTLTCAICKSGIRGLDLFLTTSPGFSSLGLGGWQVVQCCVCLGGWFLGHRPLWGWWLGGWGSCSQLRLVPQAACRPDKAESVILLHKPSRVECSLCKKRCIHTAKTSS
jgi:hypothetical protein